MSDKKDKKKHDLTAKQYENIGKRISVGRLETGGLNTKDATPHIEVMKADMYHNLEQTLEKDGHTGKLTTPDGILRGKPQIYKGFFVQIFGMVRYQSDLDVLGKFYWFGWAKKQQEIQGNKFTIQFGTETFLPLGFESEREAGNWLFGMVDKYYAQMN